MMTTPKQRGFFMPAEWHPHSHCRMAWPTRMAVWHSEAGLKAACRAYATVAKAIARFEPVTMLVNADQRLDATALCGPTVKILVAPHNDSWHRDSGPTFVISKQGELAGVNWQFNNYGNKPQLLEEEYANDKALAKYLLDTLNIPCFDALFVLEGGSFHVDGQGTALVTEQCLLNPNRNPQLSRAEIEAGLMAYLGVEKVIWLGEGLLNDDTDGHVDTIACFVAPGKVLAAITDDPNDVNYAPLQDNLARLKAATDARGRAFEIHTVSIPSAHYLGDMRMALSYVNFYIANGGIVMCSFNDPDYDQAAKNTISALFPDREVVQIPALDIYTGGGGIHCITQQQPLPIADEDD
jgi:agmatine deiminase